jgi:hypothetical protein
MRDKMTREKGVAKKSPSIHSGLDSPFKEVVRNRYIFNFSVLS